MAHVLRMFIVSQGDYFYLLTLAVLCSSWYTKVSSVVVVLLHLNADSLSSHVKNALVFFEE